MKSSAEVEREVESTRGALDRTVEALKDKMNPTELIDEARHALGGVGQQLLAKAMQQARDNPLPLAVTGIGLVWLISNASRPDAAGRDLATERRSFAPKSNGQGATGRMADKAGDLLDDAKDKIGDVAHKASDFGHDVAAKAGSYGDSLKGGFMDLIDREPLLVGALGLFVGLAIGAALPASALENKLVGPLHDDLMEKGEAMAKEGLAQAGDAAKAAYDAAKTELSGEDAVQFQRQ